MKFIPVIPYRIIGTQIFLMYEGNRLRAQALSQYVIVFAIISMKRPDVHTHYYLRHSLKMKKII